MGHRPIQFRHLLLAGLGPAAILCGPHSAALAQGTKAPPTRLPKIAFNDVLTTEQPPRPRLDQQDSFDRDDESQIGAVVVRGNEAVEEERYQQAIERFFGEPLNDEVIERLTDEIAQIAKDEGYSYARARIDREAADLGILQVSIDEGRIDEIRIEGSDNTLARDILQTLVGRPAKKSEIERALLLVSDIPSLRLRGARLKRETIEGQQRGVLMVELSERGPAFRVGADNYGSDNFGPVRARASVRVPDAFAAGDQISGSVRVNPIEPDELVFVSAAYETQVTTGGAVFSVNGSVGRTSPGEIQGAGDITGDTRRVGASLSIPIKRSRKASAWVETDFSYITISQDDLGTLLRDDTVVSASVGLRTRFTMAGGTARTGVTIERGLGILDATRLGDPLASRFDGDGVFTKVRFNTDFRANIAKRLGIYLAAAGQIADRPLLGSEEIALGGAYRVRGYNFAEVLGDEGVFGLAELRYNVNSKALPLSYLQLYGFVDGGYVSDIDASGSEGSLFSAGPGLRTRLGPLDLELEGGFPLGGSGERTIDPGPQVNVRAGLSF